MAVAAPMIVALSRALERSRSSYLPVVKVNPRKPAPARVIGTPQLSVVIVNYCQWKNTARLTRQLRQSEAVRRGAAEIVIVDNNSPKHPVARRLGKLSGVSVCRSDENQGFAKAVNRGSRLSRGEWVLLLNPDVTVEEGFLDQVLDSAQRWPALDPKAGIIGFQLRHRDGTRQASSGTFPTLLRTVFGMILPRSRRKCQHQSLAERNPVAWATGGCLLVRRDCFRQVGGMDENYFLYYEDVDFCQRARQAGWSVWYEPALRVTHHFPLHSRRVPAPLRLVTRHALLTYSRKHWPGWQARALRMIVWCEAAAREVMAQCRKQPEAAQCFRELRKLIRDMAANREQEVRKRIRFAASFLERVSSAQDGQTGNPQLK